MTQRLCAAAALVACVSAPATAQDWYGGADVSFDRFSTDDDGSDEGWSSELGAAGVAGLAFSQGYFAEAELSFAGVSAIQDPQQRGLRTGESLAGRFGRDLGDISVEGILGTMSVVSGNNDAPGLPETDRTLAAVAGSYRFDDKLTGGLLVGRLDGDGVVAGPSAADSFRGLNHVVGHLHYRLNADWAIVGSAAFGAGTLDEDNDDGSVRSVSVEAQYGLQKLGLTAYVGLSDTYMKQTDPDDANDNDDARRVSLFAGVRWVFGATGAHRARERVPLPDYLTWLAMSDGTLE